MDTLYALYREGYDHDKDVLYFTDKEAAIDHLLDHLLSVNMKSTAFIYEWSIVNKKSPMLLTV
jgi:hypothetical protein